MTKKASLLSLDVVLEVDCSFWVLTFFNVFYWGTVGVICLDIL